MLLSVKFTRKEKTKNKINFEGNALADNKFYLYYKYRCIWQIACDIQICLLKEWAGVSAKAGPDRHKSFNPNWLDISNMKIGVFFFILSAIWDRGGHLLVIFGICGVWVMLDLGLTFSHFLGELHLQWFTGHKSRVGSCLDMVTPTASSSSSSTSDEWPQMSCFLAWFRVANLGLRTQATIAC